MNAIFKSTNYNLKDIQNRNPDVFNKIYREYRDVVFNYLIIKTKGDSQIAEEIVCDTFFSAIKSAPKLKNSDNIKIWLFIIAYRRLIDYLRKKYNEKKYFYCFNYNNLLDESNIIEDNIQIRQEDIMFDKAINRLNEKYKKIIILRYIKKLRVKEISKLMGSNITIVNSLLARAKFSLKKEFNKIKKTSDIRDMYRGNRRC